MTTIKEVEGSRAEAHEAMLQEALSRPGVREFMEVYQNWQEVDKNLNLYRQAIKPQTETTTSDHANAL